MKETKEKSYYIYHIPGKKVGVTTCPESRIEKVQGYEKGEYDILGIRTDIMEAAKYEQLYQKMFGYKVDEVSYDKLPCNNKKNKEMQVNVTEQTTTFPCPVNKLKGRLMDQIGMTWKTEHGKCHIDEGSIDWIMRNVKTSMYNDNRSYVYNKAFSRYYDNHADGRLGKQGQTNGDGIFSLIRDWARERGIYAKGNSHTQYVKLQEEAGELAKALLKNDETEIVDAIGDIAVVLTNLAELRGYKIEDCIQSAYDVIAKRTGKMVGGTFVKTESL